MKKVLLSIIMICASVMSFAQIPDFTVDGAQNSVFFDSKSVKGKGSDYIQVINFSDDSDAIFAIYGYNKKEEPFLNSRSRDLLLHNRSSLENVFMF
mgnify:CR=1 FL=1